MIKRHTSSFFGKAFLWLLALSVATLVEGFLMSSTETKETHASIANLQDIPASIPEAAIHVDRVVEFVSFVVELFQLAV
ncbi:MAG: hypothetical protein AB8F78_01440 [Saprospiraceae bacterium]